MSIEEIYDISVVLSAILQISNKLIHTYENLNSFNAFKVKMKDLLLDQQD